MACTIKINGEVLAFPAGAIEVEYKLIGGAVSAKFEVYVHSDVTSQNAGRSVVWVAAPDDTVHIEHPTLGVIFTGVISDVKLSFDSGAHSINCWGWWTVLEKMNLLPKGAARAVFGSVPVDPNADPVDPAEPEENVFPDIKTAQGVFGWVIDRCNSFGYSIIMNSSQIQAYRDIQIENSEDIGGTFEITESDTAAGVIERLSTMLGCACGFDESGIFYAKDYDFLRESTSQITIPLFDAIPETWKGDLIGVAVSGDLYYRKQPYTEYVVKSRSRGNWPCVRIYAVKRDNFYERRRRIVSGGGIKTGSFARAYISGLVQRSKNMENCAIDGADFVSGVRMIKPWDGSVQLVSSDIVLNLDSPLADSVTLTFDDSQTTISGKVTIKRDEDLADAVESAGSANEYIDHGVADTGNTSVIDSSDPWAESSGGGGIGAVGSAGMATPANGNQPETFSTDPTDFGTDEISDAPGSASYAPNLWPGRIIGMNEDGTVTAQRMDANGTVMNDGEELRNCKVYPAPTGCGFYMNQPCLIYRTAGSDSTYLVDASSQSRMWAGTVETIGQNGAYKIKLMAIGENSELVEYTSIDNVKVWGGVQLEVGAFVMCWWDGTTPVLKAFPVSGNGGGGGIYIVNGLLIDDPVQPA